jgi:phosphatidylglycerol:prolipoprotein diacylglycerol transferase
VPSAFLFVHIGLDPVAFWLGPVAIHWYGIGYVVAISLGLTVAKRYALTRGISEDQFWAVALWAVAIGFAGGRLYYVVQNDPGSYLAHPFRILQVWNGGMAFFGAITATIATVAFFAWRRHWSLGAMLDTAALFALVGQPIGRLGNVVNGDIIGPPTHLPWGFVYTNANSFAPSSSVAYHPAAIYEIIANLVLIAILLPLRNRLRTGWLVAGYLAGYCLTQLVVFHWRSEPIIGLGLRQAQWTSIVLLLADAAFVAAMLGRGMGPWRPTAPAKAAP